MRPRFGTTGHSAETGRVEAFSDGVFAIAITLLILEIAVPASREGRLASDLVHLWPSYVAYASSFFTVGIMWMNHHYIFGLIRSVNRPLLLINLALLALISFIPFPTAVLAEYLEDGPGANLSTAVAFYGGALLLLTFVFAGFWAYVGTRPALTKDDASARYAMLRSLGYCAIAALGYGAGIALAYVVPTVSLALYILVAVMFLTGRLSRRAPAAAAVETE